MTYDQQVARQQQRELDLREIECQQFVEEFDAWWLTQGVK